MAAGNLSTVLLARPNTHPGEVSSCTVLGCAQIGRWRWPRLEGSSDPAGGRAR